MEAVRPGRELGAQGICRAERACLGESGASAAVNIGLRLSAVADER